MSVDSVQLVFTAFISFAITALLGFWLIPLLRRLKYGQTIKEVGPTWHKNKEGTPTMGGLMFIIGLSVSVIIAFFLFNGSNEMDATNNVGITHLFSGLVMALAYGLLGFIDDYVKVSKKRNLGLTAWQKTAVQILIAAFYLLSIYMGGDRSTIIIFPFFGQVDFGLLYYPVMVLGIYTMVNAVNITDGIDGLCSTVTFIVAIAFLIICGLLGQNNMALLSVALAGSCVGFLIWNFHPAKVFMGDTGSMFLGGVIVAIAFGVGMPVLLVFVGIAYIIDIFTVLIQMISFKLTGKRVFKMSPIHHSFEISGYSEVQIVMLFSLIALVGCTVAVLGVHLL